MNFGAWLRLQERRDDPVGDIARERRHCPTCRRLSGSGSLGDHIRNDHDPSHAALEALDRAIAEWEATR